MTEKPRAPTGSGRAEPAVGRDHYSYTVYNDPKTARTFDDRRFGGPIGELVAATQAKVLTNFVGRIQGQLGSAFVGFRDTHLELGCLSGPCS